MYRQSHTYSLTVSSLSPSLPPSHPQIYQCFWMPNNAWDVFLIIGLGFSEWRMGVLGLVGTITGALGAWFYRSCLLHANWRKVFGWSLVLMTCLDLLLLLLVFRVNLKVRREGRRETEKNMVL